MTKGRVGKSGKPERPEQPEIPSYMLQYHRTIVDVLEYEVEKSFQKFKNFTTIEDNIVTLYRYFLQKKIVEWFFLEMVTEEKQIDELLKQWENDTKYIRIEGVLAAWLMVDRNFKDPVIKELMYNLGYGLVLKYPMVIKRAGCFVSGFTKQEEIQGGVPPMIIKDLHWLAIAEIMERKPDIKLDSLRMKIGTPFSSNSVWVF
jgi:hypothetical protein